ncbi:MAG: SDR family oxidoreductase, partial [Acetobacteraceae bacterium]|nr:SDR family oxidoreductase [Acetobacteraceae bacterium]
MDLRLDGKTAFVSGSTGGIGFAIASGLAAQGARVWVNGRGEERVGEAKRRLREAHPGCAVEGIAADLATAEGAARVFAALPVLDILVNNLGIFEPKPFADIADEDWRRFFEANVLSGIRLSRHYVGGMRERDWGRILFISSESALNIPVEMIHYGMTKTAQLAVSRGLAETVAGTGVTVNAVLPGPTKSEGVATFVEQIAQAQGVGFAEAEADFFKNQRPTSLLRRFATVDEVANMVVYLASPAASATNGSAVRVDGGVVKLV